MLVAGSVLALLLAGLTVDGLLNPEVEEGDDTDPDNGGGNDTAPQALTSVGDLLDPEGGVSPDISLNARAESLGYTPLESIEALPQVELPEGGMETTGTINLTADASAEAATTAISVETVLDVTATTTLSDGSEVPFITNFSAETDVLIMEFDGDGGEAPVITVEQDPASASAIVNANGLAVTVVQDAPDLTEKNVAVYLDGVLQGLPEGISETVGSEISHDPLSVDALATIPEIEPVADVVETVSDGIPGADALNWVLDDLGGSLSDLGDSSDMLEARADIDPAFGIESADAITGSFNDDQLTGSDGQDALFGDDGDDTLSGSGGNDELHGDFGNDNLQGGDGIDFLSGGEGNDSLNGGFGRDALFGGEGDDAIHGGADNDVLHGGAGHDTLDGGAGDDVLNGTFSHGNGDQDAGDILNGGDGDDTIVIGEGDVARGGSGADVFSSGDYVENATEVGMVSDFDPSQDRIEVIYDPSSTPNPVIEVHDFTDGSGADIVLNGQVILSVTGAQGMDPGLIDLRATS